MSHKIPWTREDDEKLALLRSQRRSIIEIASEMGRGQRSIVMRCAALRISNAPPQERENWQDRDRRSSLDLIARIRAVHPGRCMGGM